MRFEFSRDLVRFVQEIGSGQFGEVWLAQVFNLAHLNPRDESEEAMQIRQKLRETSAKKLVKEFDKKVKSGRNIELAAVKRLKGILILQ